MSERDVDTMQFPGHLIRRLHQISVALFAEHMARHNIDLTPVQFSAMDAIAREPGVDQATIAARIAYDRATLGKVIDRLELKGLVLRTVSPSDRRARLVALSRAGETLLAQAIPVAAALQPKILAGLSTEEQDQMTRLLAKAPRATSKTWSREPHSPSERPQDRGMISRQLHYAAEPYS